MRLIFCRSPGISRHLEIRCRFPLVYHLLHIQKQQMWTFLPANAVQGPGGDGLEKRPLPPALRPKRRRTAREQAAAAALLAAGKSVAEAEGAQLSVHVPGKPGGGKEAGSREAGSRPQSGASTPLRRAGSSAAAASVRRKSNPGVLSLNSH